ncbi:LPS translocon maturation chaperone LptM [Congregibacter sp.]|uniref:LPS translocon maturation chaperone LptM n=1 Tax=Congregibacter sp. TaxID=2744308 RepID=UPI0039E4104F
MQHLLTFNILRHRRRSPGKTATLSHSLACALALTLTGCGQMGPLYQPLPEQPAAESSAADDETAPGRGN